MKHADFANSLAISAAALAVAIGVAQLVGAWNPEATILREYHEPLAAWLRGNTQRSLVTYPVWGYAALLAVFSPSVLHAIQLIGAAAAMGLVWLLLGHRIAARRTLAVLLVLAIPWHALAVSLWSPAPAALLSLLALLVLGVGLERGNFFACALGGTLLGLAANFRSEALALVIAVPVAALLARILRLPWGRPLHASLAALCAMAAILPWGFHVQRASGHWSFTGSNGGMVALISLGQLPRNPWGIVHHDSFASEWLKRQGHHLDPLSPEGDRILRGGFQNAIRAHPAAYASKVVRNLRNALIGGLYVGEMEVPDEERVALDRIRERWKERLGLNPNIREIEAQGRADRISSPSPSASVWVALAWQTSGVALGAIFVLFGLAGIVLARRRLANDGVLSLFALAIAVQFAVMGALQYLPRHTTSLYPMLAPFAATSIAACGRLRSTRRTPRSASSRG
jgi:4-amino-4-deoxy-L-arabinose transferase-like glycosyltransferase